MGHRPPGVVLRRGLGEPDVARVARELAGLAGSRDRVGIADLAAGGVDEIRAPLHLADQLGVEEVLRLRMERRVDRYHVAHANQRLDVRVIGNAELLLHLVRQSVPVGVMEPDLEGLQASQHR